MLQELISLQPLQLDWMQVDVSSHGADAKRFSLHHVCRDTWRNRHMPLSVFERVVPYLHRVKMVHFRGWGEPLSNPDFFRMAALAQKSSCKLTTNVQDSKTLRETVLEKLVQMEFMGLTVNISSVSEELNYQRTGGSLAQLFRVLTRLQHIKEEYGAPHPRVNLLYTLHRSSLDELEQLPAFCAGRGIDMLLVNPLTIVPEQEALTETVVPQNEEQYQALQKRLEHLRLEAAKRGMDLHYFLMHGGKETLRCIENVEKALFLGAEGDVSPCIFSQLPMDGEASFYFQNMKLPVLNIVFGNVLEHKLRVIWNRPVYRSFRKAFSRERLPRQCGMCWRQHIVAM